MSTKAIFYEHPMQELVHLFLRLEFLFTIISQAIAGKRPIDSHTALIAVLNTLRLLDRPDLRSKLTKELHRYSTNLNRLRELPNIEQQKLGQVLTELEKIIDFLNKSHGKFGQKLRENDFLTVLRQRLISPSGIYHFDIPAYQLWLHSPMSSRHKDLESWYQQFSDLELTCQLLLQLIRESSSPHELVIKKGFYQTNLDPQIPCQLIRVIIPKNADVYPEISASRYGLTVRLLQIDTNHRPAQIAADCPIELTYCII